MNKTPIILILPDIRSAMNIGAIFRSADAAGIEMIYLCGYSATPDHPKVLKTAIGAETSVTWEYQSDVHQVITDIKNRGYQIISLEKNEKSINIFDFKPCFPIALVVGNEIHGVNDNILDKSDVIIHLPMLGQKESLNVATATGIVLYNFLEKFNVVS